MLNNEQLQAINLTNGNMRKLAIEWSKEVRKWLTAKELKSVIKDDKNTGFKTSGLYLFGDVNEGLLGCFENITGQTFDVENDDHCDFVMCAEAIAKATNYTIKL